MRMFLASAFLLIVPLVLAPQPARAELPDDPLKSNMWPALAARYFADAPVEFDARVRVVVPSMVENQAQVPVTVDARLLKDVQKVIVFADLNPIQHVLTLFPDTARPYISFRMKVEQGTPVRAAALTKDGVWHVGSVYLDAAGGGCSAPAMARKDADWTQTLGQAQGRVWRETEGVARVRFRIRHPMDTGLAKDNTPAYFIERLVLTNARGETLATLELFEPVSEDPTLTLLVGLSPADTALTVSGRDNNGRVYKARLAIPVQESALEAQRVDAGAARP